MNWSSKWPSEAGNLVAKVKGWDSAIDPEAAKVFEDAAKFGTGYSKDGKHVPVEDVFVEPNAIKLLTIIHGHKQYDVIVIIIGDLALDYDDEGWNIYHVPTLTLFSKAVPHCYKHEQQCTDNIYGEICNCIGGPQILCYEYDKQPLLNWMKKVQENYTTAWTMLRCLTPETYSDSGQSAKDIILKWCLSVKVE